jgi:hypothetical protein
LRFLRRLARRTGSAFTRLALWRFAIVKTWHFRYAEGAKGERALWFFTHVKQIVELWN